MTVGMVGEAGGLFSDAFAAIPVATDGADAEELIAALRVQARIERRVHRAMVDTVAALQRLGAFAERGQRAETALADLWGVERAEARRVVTAAEQTTSRVDLQGQVLPPLLPHTAVAFAAGDRIRLLPVGQPSGSVGTSHQTMPAAISHASERPEREPQPRGDALLGRLPRAVPDRSDETPRGRERGGQHQQAGDHQQ